MDDPAQLRSWNQGATRDAIERFVLSVTEGADAVPVEERIAVFDNDGTLWSEKPMPTQLHYVVEQWRVGLVLPLSAVIDLALESLDPPAQAEPRDPSRAQTGR